jgi:HTH-type transcriptional regulator / antitoxin HigA
VDIRPIRTDEDHTAALKEIERLWGSPVGTEDGDKLDILITLVSAYEDKKWPIREADPVEALEFAIAEMGHTQAELADLLGSRPRASEILNRKRPLTIEMAYKIATGWGIPAEILVRPYHLEHA